MHVRGSVRRVALLTLPSALAMFAVMYSLLPPVPLPAGQAQVYRHPQPVQVAAAQLTQPTPSLEAAVQPVSEVPALAPKPASARQLREQKPGKLSINTRPWSTVYLGSRVLGTTPLANISVPRGNLMLKLVDRDGNVHLRRVAGAKGRERSAFYDFQAPLKRLRR
jgi:hypothetical protein